MYTLMTLVTLLCSVYIKIHAVYFVYKNIRDSDDKSDGQNFNTDTVSLFNLHVQYRINASALIAHKKVDVVYSIHNTATLFEVVQIGKSTNFLQQA